VIFRNNLNGFWDFCHGTNTGAGSPPRPGTSKKALFGGKFPQNSPEIKKVEIVIFRT
jgi:hypothetical protein